MGLLNLTAKEAPETPAEEYINPELVLYSAGFEKQISINSLKVGSNVIIECAVTDIYDHGLEIEIGQHTVLYIPERLGEFDTISNSEPGDYVYLKVVVLAVTAANVLFKVDNNIQFYYPKETVIELEGNENV